MRVGEYDTSTEAAGFKLPFTLVGHLFVALLDVLRGGVAAPARRLLDDAMRSAVDARCADGSRLLWRGGARRNGGLLWVRLWLSIERATCARVAEIQFICHYTTGCAVYYGIFSIKLMEQTVNYIIVCWTYSYF